jgi:hypothetical protein
MEEALVAVADIPVGVAGADKDTPLHSLMSDVFVVGVWLLPNGIAGEPVLNTPVPAVLAYALTVIPVIAVPVVVVIVYCVDVVNTFEEVPSIVNKTL